LQPINQPVRDAADTITTNRATPDRRVGAFDNYLIPGRPGERLLVAHAQAALDNLLKKKPT
jgi:hypothetical protein